MVLESTSSISLLLPVITFQVLIIMHMNSYYNLMCGFPDFIICLSILIFITPIHVLIIQPKFKIFQGLPLF